MPTGNTKNSDSRRSCTSLRCGTLFHRPNALCTPLPEILSLLRCSYHLPVCTNHTVQQDFLRQYRTKSVWRLCTPSACKFPVIFHKNAREYIKYSLRFLFHLTKNLTTHLSHNLCAVLPLLLYAISLVLSINFLLRKDFLCMAYFASTSLHDLSSPAPWSAT